MRYLVTGSQMRAIDQDTIQNIGIPSLVLMERAAECVDRKAEQLCDQKTLQILAICGVGNNGADGVAAARMLYLHGFDVLVVVVGNEAHATKEFEVQKGIAEKLEIAELLDRYPEEISGGQAKRASLARALLADKKYLLLDEPLSNVDRKTKDIILDYLSEEVIGKKSVIYVTHDAEERNRMKLDVLEL